MLILFLVLAVLVAFVGAQIQLSEFLLLTGRFNYRPQWPQVVTLIATMLAFIIIAYDIVTVKFSIYLVTEVMFSVIIWMFSEWLLARLSPKSLWISTVWRVIVCVATAMVIGQETEEPYPLLPFLVMGLYLRNSPLGVVHGKPFFIAYGMVRRANRRQVEKAKSTELLKEPVSKELLQINVAERGIVPNTRFDVLHKVQALIDEVGRQGGGTLFFPRGRYLFNMSGKKEFLQINHSHITLEGEYDEQGRLLTEFVNCGTTVRGERNPWLSPFFITTGEALQPSNQFWGLDFRKPKGIHLESSSLSDPGGDGMILKPAFATKIVSAASLGSTRLQVEDSSKVSKYILLGMYNTTPDGQLLKKLLGMNELRPEWITAHRAGEEEAPSLQWLVEVKCVIDAHTIELVRPLLYDCQLDYAPAIFNVEMLEDIHICHMRISSRWNGLFHHHGLPIYYSVGQAQEMDYGWNAINMKRTAHSTVEDVEIRNFTNPIYVQDSREVTVQHTIVSGYDGHQGIKVYCHTCDCMFHDIVFLSHYADMMGGEGNAYANTFSHIQYLNPTFNPVDYDFHGFSEGPFSPPAFNVFENVEGFRYIKGAGAIFMQPACAAGNIWRQCISEGEQRGTLLFYAMPYRVKSGFIKYVTAIGYTMVMMIKKKKHSLTFAKEIFANKLRDIDSKGILRNRHAQFFPNSHIEQMQTTAKIESTKADSRITVASAG